MESGEPAWLSGGTGLVGGRLLGALRTRDVPARVATRSPGRLAGRPGVEGVGWDGIRPPAASLAGCGIAIHLSGEPVFGGLPTASRRARIRDSRIASTRALVAALGELPSAERPRLLLCASAVGYYGDRGEELLTEDAAGGDGFLADVCRDWEAEAAGARQHGLRVVSLRIGVVLARDGGALSLMAPIFRLGLGGRVGSGRQWFPWIHVDDLVALIVALAEAPGVEGPVNAVSPSPVRNAELTASLGRVLRRPTLLPVPAFALRAGLGAVADELLASRRVEPAVARKLGFQWARAELDDALRTELERA